MWYTCQSVAGRSQECIRTADAGRMVRGSENSAPASPLVHSDHALQECSPPNMCSDLRTHVMRQARIEVTAAYALNHLELRVLKPSELLQDFVYLRQDPRNPASPRFLNSAIAAIIARAFYNNGKWGIGAMAGNQDKFQFLSANMMALVGTVLYNAIKEYHDDGTRKTIHFHGHTVEDNYNAIREKWKRLSEIRRLLIWDALKQQIAIHANHIENSGSNEETRVRLRESSGEIHDILLREFRGADDFTESVTHNDDEQVWFQNKGKGWSIVTDSTWDEFAMLAEEYTIDNRIVHALALTKDEWELEPEDCDALVERYEEEINCSDLYSTV
ncbi:hypothetical protein SNOG_02341 [Parastagonospora nodorum SN15]|uniref:DUF6532 domain-containing protein n=1 Tax=Phaeosphaeria nodorum (strain SN15 / ATCC MYA-4574 / FGSC 10173) TaxID=321614 RepID=Q0V0X3_PHANO|nr:hypothetical protein SNOG_02341 [Parastagonospora nodorum SN15]EAT90553.1 hypothetical protein SNOG_02341 [Parastagonospora nodorum SN15]